MPQFAVNILGMEVDVVPLTLVLGLDHEIIIGAHEICITEEIGSIPEPVEIEFMEPIRRKQYSSLWYGGQIAAIRVHGCVFEVHALGDVYA